ncbi:flippase [Geoglobus sp.]
MLARRVAKNAIYNSSAVLIGNISGLIITIYLARALGPENFGLYSLSISVAFLVLTFTDLGITQTLVRYISEAYGKGNRPLVRGYIKELGKVKLILAVSVSATLLIISNYLALSVFHNEKMATPLRIVSLFILVHPLSTFLTGIFNGLNDFRANLVRSIVYELFRVVSILLLVTLGFAVIGAISGFVIASAASAVSLLALLLRNYRDVITGRAEKINLKRVVRFTGYLTVGSIAWTVFAYVDSVMIGMFLPEEYVGYYRAGYSIIGAVAGILSLPVVLFPVFVQLEGDDLKNAFNRVFKYSAILAVPASMGLPAISREIILVVYGREYLAALPVFWILSFLILRSAVGFWAVIFNAKEMPEYPVKSILIGMALNIALNYAMIPVFGISGAAAATLTSNAVVWGILAYLSKRQFDIFFSPQHLTRPAFAGFVMTAFLLTQKPATLVQGVIAVLVAVVLYFAVLYAIRGVDRGDIEYILRIIGKQS